MPILLIGKLKNKFAFTLLEVTVVIFIIALFLGFSLPSFSTFVENPSQRESQNLYRVLQKIVLEVSYRKKSGYLKFSFSNHTFSWKIGDKKGILELKELKEIEALTKGKINTGELKLLVDSYHLFEPFKVFLGEGNERLVVSWNPYLKMVEVEREND